MINQGTKSDDSVAIGGLSNEDLAQKNHSVFTSYFFTIPNSIPPHQKFDAAYSEQSCLIAMFAIFVANNSTFIG